MNEFKFSALRQFGSENISFTATIHSVNRSLSEDEINEQIAQFDGVISSAFVAVANREIKEKDVLIATSEARTAAVSRHDAALKEEMRVASEAKQTMRQAEREANKYAKK